VKPARKGIVALLCCCLFQNIFPSGAAQKSDPGSPGIGIRQKRSSPLLLLPRPEANFLAASHVNWKERGTLLFASRTRLSSSPSDGERRGDHFCDWQPSIHSTALACIKLEEVGRGEKGCAAALHLGRDLLCRAISRARDGGQHFMNRRFRSGGCTLYQPLMTSMHMGGPDSDWLDGEGGK